MARRASYENSKKEDGESHWPRHSGDEVQPLEERVRMREYSSCSRQCAKLRPTHRRLVAHFVRSSQSLVNYPAGSWRLACRSPALPCLQTTYTESLSTICFVSAPSLPEGGNISDVDVKVARRIRCLLRGRSYFVVAPSLFPLTISMAS
ncbi:hypothetical protein M8818_003820 [Zalaria obscura]|uniref:Uncharacterized protein n=1 Tax=Zalaria obscura TaxID=2024903 RepID=A0ACC3SFB3_9PEZI